MFTRLAEEANLGYAGPAGCRTSAAACLALWPGWLWCCLQRCLPPSSGVWLSVHRTGDGRVVHRSAAPIASPAPPATLFQRCPGGLYKMSYAVEVAATFLDGLVLTPAGRRGQGPFCTR
jgi:hypothetical protein